MENKTYIYSLVDPITHEVRYIGKTVHLKNRYSSHITRAKLKRTHKECWIYSLLEKGLKPEMVILEECNDNWTEREQYYIKQYDNLTNLTDGGEGSYGYKPTEETKQLISKNHADISGDKNPLFGKVTSGAFKSGSDHPRSQPVIIDGITYESLRIAAKALNLSKTTVKKRYG